MTARWWTYQRERFPLLRHGPLIAAFSLSAASVSAALRGAAAPGPAPLLVAFGTAFLFFLQLRIADEFKDAEEDARYRPYRPVPRGLVTLRELGTVAGVAMGLQLGLALWLHPPLGALLGLAWLYLGLMTREFFAGPWLRARPLAYLATHLLVVPLIDLYATACDWLVAGGGPPRGLPWFLAVSLFNGAAIEIGRKVRAPADEEPGVVTYSARWGRGPAILAWLAALGLAGVAAWPVAAALGLAAPVGGVAGVLLGLAARAGWRFSRRPDRERARLVETLSGWWTLGLYLALGALPLLGRR